MRTSRPNRTPLHLRILAGLIAVLAAYDIWRMLHESSQPGYYYEYSVLAPLMHEFKFPYLADSISVGLLAAEAVLLVYTLARQAGPLWMRGICCLAVLLPTAWFGIMSAMHSPPYYAAHVLWLVHAALLVLLVVLASALTGYYRRLRSRSGGANPSVQPTGSAGG